MKHLNYLSLILVLLLFAACKNQDLKAEADNAKEVNLTPDEVRVLKAMNSQKAITPEQAREMALEAARKFAMPNGTRLQRQIIEDVAVVTNVNLTKSAKSEVDTVLYVVNFADQQGFSVISADFSDAVVIAFVENGSLHIGDTIDNPGLQIFMSRVPAYIEQKKAEKLHLIDSLQATVLAKIITVSGSGIPTTKGVYDGGAGWGDNEPCDIIEPEYELFWESSVSITTAEVAPMVKVRWHQKEPYNTQLTNTKWLAGCVPVAIANLLSYHKYPQSIDGFLFNWYQMTSTPDASWLNLEDMRQVAVLIQKLGAKLNTTYGETGSPTKATEAPRLLNQMGFCNRENFNLLYWVDYNNDSQAILNSLNKSRPVLMQGYSHRESHWSWFQTYYSFHNGHCWVIDGYKTIQTTTTSVYFINYRNPESNVLQPSQEYTSVQTRSNDYVHCCFGWGRDVGGGELGTMNGYYSPFVFDASDKGGPVSTKSDQEDYYRWNLQMITNIGVGMGTSIPCN